MNDDNRDDLEPAAFSLTCDDCGHRERVDLNADANPEQDAPCLHLSMEKLVSVVDVVDCIDQLFEKYGADTRHPDPEKSDRVLRDLREELKEVSSDE